MKKVTEFVDSGIGERLFTAASLTVSLKDSIVLEYASGTVGGQGTSRVEPDTLFDLASLTKVLATMPCWVLQATQDRNLLDRPLKSFFPDCPEDKSEITPRHLLAHSSGFPAWRPYYLMFLSQPNATRIQETILNEHLAYLPGCGTIYSDLGFILLGLIAEMETGHKLDEIVRERVYGPMGLSGNLMFNPDGPSRGIAFTRIGDKPGLVNDLNARKLGGVAGHAGLFGNGLGVVKLALEFLKSIRGNKGFFDHETMKIFSAKADFEPESTRCLGFDTPSPTGSSSGRFFSGSSLGHTGFTGTSLWIDTRRDIIVSFLTNRVFYGESDTRIKEFRPILHDLIMQELIGD